MSGEKNSFQALIVGFAILVSIIWFIFFQTLSYKSHTPGQEMKDLKATYQLHLWCGLLFSICHILRPFWSYSVQDAIWNSKIGCHIWARLSQTCMWLLFMCPLYFSYLKTRFYLSLSSSNRWEHRLLKYCIYCSVAGNIVIAQYFISSGDFYVQDGVKVCIQTKKWFYTFGFTTISITTILYFWMTSIFRRNYDDLQSIINSVPEMKKHICINKYLSSTIWTTSICIYFIMAIEDDLNLSLLLFDFFANNLIMFFTIYGNIYSHKPDAFSISVQSTDEFSVTSINFGTRQSAVFSALDRLFLDDDWIDIIPLIIEFTYHSRNRKHWIEYPGMSAVCVHADVIDRNLYLEEYLISDEEYLTSLNIDHDFRRTHTRVWNHCIMCDFLTNRNELFE